MALALGSQEDWRDVRIDATSPRGRDPWFQAKAKLASEMDFPNLPYYVDSKVVLSQSDAILRYLGRTFGLMGDEGQEHRVDVAIEQVKDEEGALSMHSYRTGPTQLLAWFEHGIETFLESWVKFFSGRDFVTGTKLSIADLKLYTYLYKLTVVQALLGSEATAAALAGNGGWVSDYMKRVEEVPRLKEYMASERYQRRPLNNPSAQFNN
jgi:glutathione S-transferase